MYRGRISSWNLRDHHMADTVEALVSHLSNRDGPAKVVVWAHNSHVGDARATELGSHGELTLGQLIRRRWGDEALLVGFTTDAGTVTAASEWGGPAERKRVRPAMAGSWEAAFREVPRDRFLLPMVTQPPWRDAVLLERAIGVISTGPTPSVSATGSTLVWPSSSTRSSTWTARPRWSRSSGPPCGTAVRLRRPTRPGSERRASDATRSAWGPARSAAIHRRGRG